MLLQGSGGWLHFSLTRDMAGLQGRRNVLRNTGRDPVNFMRRLSMTIFLVPFIAIVALFTGWSVNEG